MALTLQTILDAPIIELNSIDSTNNYAMRLIDADTAQDGLTVISEEQTAGKGQRGKTWLDAPGESLLMSIVTCPTYSLEEQFLFNAAVTTAVAEVLLSIYENWDIRIKWPNDIIINDKKAGGILIENVLRGDKWAYAIIGLGLNVFQNRFAPELIYATSLHLESDKYFPINDLSALLRKNILTILHSQLTNETIINSYNKYLYRKGLSQKFLNGQEYVNATVLGATAQGQLAIQKESGDLGFYTHGTEIWIWE